MKSRMHCGDMDVITFAELNFGEAFRFVDLPPNVALKIEGGQATYLLTGQLLAPNLNGKVRRVKPSRISQDGEIIFVDA